NVGGMFFDRSEYGACFGVEDVFGPSVTDLPNRIPNNFGNIYVTMRGYLSRYQNHPGGDRSFTSNPGIGVPGDNLVQHSVRNLVTDLVRVPRCDRFRRKQRTSGISWQGESSSFIANLYR